MLRHSSLNLPIPKASISGPPESSLALPISVHASPFQERCDWGNSVQIDQLHRPRRYFPALQANNGSFQFHLCRFLSYSGSLSTTLKRALLESQMTARKIP